MNPILFREIGVDESLHILPILIILFILSKKELESFDRREKRGRKC